jgi:hypothetical protein
MNIIFDAFQVTFGVSRWAITKTAPFNIQFNVLCYDWGLVPVAVLILEGCWRNPLDYLTPSLITIRNRFMKIILGYLKCVALQFNIKVPMFRTNQWDLGLSGKHSIKVQIGFQTSARNARQFCPSAQRNTVTFWWITCRHLVKPFSQVMRIADWKQCKKDVATGYVEFWVQNLDVSGKTKLMLLRKFGQQSIRIV